MAKGKFWKLSYEEPQSLYSSPNRATEINSRKIRSTGNVARMGEGKIASKNYRYIYRKDTYRKA